jgi:cellulose synthase/poly-beta-1,6-N-acetylglucosamine synthase-like glycosyltransferase
MNAAVRALEWFFLLYFALAGAGYLVLHLLAIPKLNRRIALRPLEDLPPVYAGFEPPVSLLVPAFNEEASIVGTVGALLELDYPDFEVVVVNDGSGDGTLPALQAAFDLEAFPEAHWRRLRTQPVRTIYHSRSHPALRVIDKEHGGRADTLNVGINAARHPLFCTVNAGAILRRDSLLCLVEPFLDDPATVACGGAARLANGCTVAQGRLQDVRLPRSPLALLHVVEYLRAFLFGRLGWATVNAVLAFSGTFAVFRKDVVVEIGGYRAGIPGEDKELLARLHRVLRTRAERYAIHFVPDPICWLRAPETLAALADQRMRWQQGLAEGLHLNAGLVKAGGAAGLGAFPFLMAFECYGPLIELAGYAFMTAMFLAGQVPATLFLAFLALAFSLGFLASVSALVLEDLAFRTYRRPSQMATLVAVAALENLAYRQLVAVWRLVGLTRWLRGRRPRDRARPRP